MTSEIAYMLVAGFLYLVGAALMNSVLIEAAENVDPGEIDTTSNVYKFVEIMVVVFWFIFGTLFLIHKTKLEK